jgi:hypothetical protein
MGFDFPIKIRKRFLCHVDEILLAEFLYLFTKTPSNIYCSGSKVSSRQRL